MESKAKTADELLQELDETRRQLYEAQETIEAIRTGQIDAIVVQTGTEPQLYTLKTADRAYRVFIEKMTEGAVTLDRHGMILYANTQFAAMVALPLSGVIGLSFNRFIGAEDKANYTALFTSAWVEDCKGELAIENEGQKIYVQLSLTPLELEEGTSLSVIVTDLTVQKAVQLQLEENNYQLEQLNKKLEASNHDLQQFASVASHDLQEPLRKIQMFLTIMKTKTAGRLEAEAMQYMDKAIIAASRMKALVLDVLSYSRLSSNEGEFVATNLADIIKEVVEDFEMIIEEKKAQVIYGNLPSPEVNFGQIRQMFQNLISNALKFSKKDEPPVIRISAELIAQKSFSSPKQEDGPYCLLMIKDNGIGFDEKYTSNIFSLFKRLHSKEEYEGSGIGLSITKKIIEKHQGMIDVKSCLGSGSEFLIILPVRHRM